MKYDIYKGTKEDMKESGGELMLVKANMKNVKEFCKRQGIKAGDFLDGSYMTVGDRGFWLEEAM